MAQVKEAMRLSNDQTKELCKVALLGVPFGIAAGRFGTEAGDRAVRTEALQGALESLGYNVGDHGSLPVPTAIAPGVGTPVPGGLTYREAHLGWK